MEIGGISVSVAHINCNVCLRLLAYQRVSLHEISYSFLAQLVALDMAIALLANKILKGYMYPQLFS